MEAIANLKNRQLRLERPREQTDAGKGFIEIIDDSEEKRNLNVGRRRENLSPIAPSMLTKLIS